LNEAITKYGKPEIMNSDQGLQFTGSAWITTLTDAKIKISMPLGECTHSPAGNRWSWTLPRQHLY
jgi:putative transposase